MMWSLVAETLRLRYPTVKRISTEALAAYLRALDVDPILLDVRTAEEYAVSHLPGAQRVPPETTLVPPELADAPQDALIVLYCSVGYRSAALAQRLTEPGYTRVYNLEGSIFKWANEHRPLVNDRGTTSVVHPYNRIWGRLLDDDVRADVPG